MALAGLIGPSTHTDGMTIVDGLWREEEGSIGPARHHADSGNHFCELLTECAEREWRLEVKHAKAHRTEKEKKATT